MAETISDEAKARRRELALKGMTLSWWAEQQPDAPAIISPTGTRTFSELNARANQVARALRDRGIKAGDALALICTNRPEFAEVLAACQRSGLRFTPINWHLTADEAAYIVDDCEAKVIVADARVGELAAAASASIDRVQVRLSISGDVDGFESYERAIESFSTDNIDDGSLGGSMLYTSGTTGRPKGVHRPSAVGRAAAVTSATTASTAGYRSGARNLNLLTGPLYHAAPLAFSLSAPLAYGAGVVMMEAWDAEEALRLIDEHRITHTHMVPTMFHRLLSLPEDVRSKYDISSLGYVLHGAAPCPVEVKKALMDWLGPIVHEYYAATEGSGATVDAETWLKKPGTVGKPVDRQAIVCDEDGEELPIGEIGLVFMKAPAEGKFAYYKDDDKTSGAYRPQGDYFTLGDVGYLDDEGYLFLTDRSANLIISGGVNIYPAEVDAVLLQHPAVGDAATIGVPNEEWGEEVKAVIELQRDVEPTDALAAELIAFCRDRLAHYKCPRTVDFVDELPRQDNGKIYKRLLRDKYRAAGV